MASVATLTLLALNRHACCGGKGERRALSVLKTIFRYFS